MNINILTSSFDYCSHARFFVCATSNIVGECIKTPQNIERKKEKEFYSYIFVTYCLTNLIALLLFNMHTHTHNQMHACVRINIDHLLWFASFNLNFIWLTENTYMASRFFVVCYSLFVCMSVYVCSWLLWLLLVSWWYCCRR